MRLRYVVLILTFAVALSYTVSAFAGGPTLRSLDKRLRALTALVLLDDRHPPRYEHRVVSIPLAADPNGNGRFYHGDATCGYDETAVGGGADLHNAPGGSAILSSYPSSDTTWHVEAYIEPNPYTTGLYLTGYAVCAQLVTP